MNHRKRVWSIVFVAALAAGCGSGDADEPASSLSRAQRDSVLADSPLPGAAAVRGALDAADTAQTRAAALDELSK